MMESVYWAVAVGAIVAGFVQGLSGFAFGMVAMSCWAWFLEPQLAAVLAVCGAWTGQMIAAFTRRRTSYWQILLPVYRTDDAGCADPCAGGRAPVCGH
ncbi:hypothetical protein ACU6HM_00185 [Alcaligenes sp. RM2]|uniref:hypothetical protein n=1 Tax=Alcaligenes TaxID=507 RepID=UPI003F6AC8AB